MRVATVVLVLTAAAVLVIISPPEPTGIPG